MSSQVAVVAESGVDAGVPWHYGDPMREQRVFEAGSAVVDLSHRGVLTLTGPDRLTWLHSLTTQHLTDLQPGVGVTTLVLSPQGHVEHVLYGVDDGTTFWAHTEPGAAPALVAWLDRMRFMMRVEVAERTADTAVVWHLGDVPAGLLARDGLDSLGGHELFVPRAQLADVLDLAPRAGTWALEARRIEAGVPRVGLDTDHRTIPNEIGLLGVAVHLDKGCYRGQETVARVHTLGRPPRRLVRLLLDGSVDTLPAVGSSVELAGRSIGVVGGSARHHELGPVALALVKRNTDPAAELLVDGVAARAETLVDPDVGLHVRPRL
ncbi:YgfZ/GcvT domain-containing protein [Microlunatus capsulatus]|uniref:Folate-binding protein YgfZ n=1 Tax=Microlunatus capsulatus TaxID=99117 RepID=A0ABS4Z9W6_9ACTN|nr:folate-binding protein YgfZ [Microlunatus capsulatus]MBP2417834.1 folate-binding protein YgfZ [Microlunatus capsulatus]